MYCAFVVGWLSISPVLVFVYRALSTERPGTRALLWGAFGTGSFLAGTSLGFVLFLSLGLDLGGAYGGSLAPGDRRGRASAGCSCCTRWCWSATSRRCACRPGAGTRSGRRSRPVRVAA